MNAMNAIETKFGAIFMDLTYTLVQIFPTCPDSRRINKLLQEDPEKMNTIKLDWARNILPYNIEKYQKGMIHYFNVIEKHVSKSNVFNQLNLKQKYISLGEAKDSESQDALCGYLFDLQKFALDDTRVDLGYSVEEPTTPQSDKDTSETGENEQPRAAKPKRKSRFDSPRLHKKCVDALGKENEPLVDAMRRLCVDIPEFNILYARSSDDEIVRTMLVTKPLLPMIVQMVENKTLPIRQIISMVAKQMPDPNAPTSGVVPSSSKVR